MSLALAHVPAPPGGRGAGAGGMLRRTMGQDPASPFGRFRANKLFRPASVVVIGGGTLAGARVLENLRAGAFAGPILVADTEAEIGALPQSADLAVICAEGDAVRSAFAALGRCGTQAAVVVGMATGLRALAQENGVRAFGPGSFGIAAPGIGLNATTAHRAPRPGRIALVSQSAALCRAVIDWAEPNGVGFSYIIGIGGNDDLGFATALDWLSRDPGTGAILLDLRRIKDARAFLSAARAAARLRPVVAIRAGGRLLDPAGAADAALEAALRRCGVLLVFDLADLLAAAETLTRARPAGGEALAIATNAIGPGWLAADAALREGLTLAALAPATREVLRLALPEPLRARVSHPDERAAADLVYAGTEVPTRLGEAAALLAGAPEVSGVLVVHAPTGRGDDAAMAAIMAAAQAVRVPLLVTAMGEAEGAAHRARLAAADVPAFPTPEEAVRGFKHLVQDRRNRAAARELPSSIVLQIAPDRAAVAAAFAAARQAGRLTLTQDEALAVLAAYGIATVPTRRARDADEAVAAAEVLGWPVVVKRRRADRPVPGGRGALALDLRDAGAVRDTVNLLARRPEPEAEAGVIVQAQVARGQELLVRVGEDALFGPVISFGQGGRAADVLDDVALDLPPLNLTLAQALIGRTRVGRALRPPPDQSQADIAAIADALVRISQFIVDFPEIAELEVNPLFAVANGVQAADAWLRLRDPGAAPARLAIAPYPAELSETFHGGREIFTIRPIRPEDAEAHAAFFARLPAQDVRYRFFSAMRELSPEQIARLTQVDYDREIAFIAVREASGETVGVARLARETIDGPAEFAVVVQPDAKGQGLGTHLIERLIAWARQRGMPEIFGQILADNAPMLGLVRRLGFTLRRVPGDETTVEARLPLDRERP
jgi:acetyltransferase